MFLFQVTMSTLSDFLDDTLDKCGGFGLFQFLVIGSLFLGEFSVAWSILMMTFGGAIPDWSCDTWSNKSSYLITINDTYKSCSPPDNYTGFSCVHKTFDPSLHTVVSEVRTSNMLMLLTNKWNNSTYAYIGIYYTFS